tara:strand:+ start:6879 stop:8234 length:1356 start_codon:yes stop_codon:yes gene_type:complete
MRLIMDSAPVGGILTRAQEAEQRERIDNGSLYDDNQDEEYDLSEVGLNLKPYAGYTVADTDKKRRNIADEVAAINARIAERENAERLAAEALRKEEERVREEHATKMLEWEEIQKELLGNLETKYSMYFVGTGFMERSLLKLLPPSKDSSRAMSMATKWNNKLIEILGKTGFSNLLMMFDACGHSYFLPLNSGLHKKYNALIQKSDQSGYYKRYRLCGGEHYFHLIYDAGRLVTSKVTVEDCEYDSESDYDFDSDYWMNYTCDPIMSWNLPMPRPKFGTKSLKWDDEDADNGRSPLDYSSFDKIHVGDDGETYGSVIETIDRTRMICEFKLQDEECHRCAVCAAIFRSGVREELTKQMTQYYPALPVRRYLHDGSKHKFYSWQQCPSSPRVKAVPWSRDHITRLVNMSAFAFRTKNFPASLISWADANEPLLWAQYLDHIKATPVVETVKK